MYFLRTKQYFNIRVPREAIEVQEETTKFYAMEVLYPIESNTVMKVKYKPYQVGLNRCINVETVTKYINHILETNLNFNNFK